MLLEAASAVESVLQEWTQMLTSVAPEEGNEALCIRSLGTT